MATALATTSKRSILESIGARYQIDPAKVMSVLSATAFKQSKEEPPLTPEEFQAALIVANQYELNPFTKEIFAFRSKGKLLTVVSIDGWCAVINRRPELNGIEFTEQFENGKIFSVTCKIHRKDRALPIVVTEYLSECQRDTDPWKKSPIRMLRHKALIQCGRVAFSVSGIVDPEEAETIAGGYSAPIIDAQRTSGTRTQQVAKLLEGKTAARAPEQPETASRDAAFAERFDILGWDQEKRTGFLALDSTDSDKLAALDAEIDRANG